MLKEDFANVLSFVDKWLILSRVDYLNFIGSLLARRPVTLRFWRGSCHTLHLLFVHSNLSIILKNRYVRMHKLYIPVITNINVLSGYILEVFNRSTNLEHGLESPIKRICFSIF